MTKFVLVHGWGCDSRCWDAIAPALRAYGDVKTLELPGFSNDCTAPSSLEALVDQLADRLHESSVWIGWSLGAMLGVQVAERHPHKINALISIAANASFVARDDYPHAMPFDTFQQFKAGFAQSSSATLKRFYSLLSQGAASERDITKTLRHYMPAYRDDAALTLLDFLGGIDNRNALAQLTQPHLQVFALQDALVPVQAIEAISASSRHAPITIDAPHALPLTHADELLARLTPFLKEIATPAKMAVDKRKVARTFSKAAASYDQMAALQRHIGDELAAYLPESLMVDGVVVDLGSGTGHYTAVLAQRYKNHGVIALDLAEGMLRYARQQARTHNIHYLAADAEQLPLKSESCALLFSNLALQWCRDLTSVWSEIFRSLQPGGIALVTTLGPSTLHELKAAWSSVDAHTHVNAFDSYEAVVAAISSTALQIVDSHVSRPVFYFPTLDALMQQLKGVGAKNINKGARSGLTSAAQLDTLRAAYERYRTLAGLPATYEVYTFVVSRAVTIPRSTP